jgi:hypothetical protein
MMLDRVIRNKQTPPPRTPSLTVPTSHCIEEQLTITPQMFLALATQDHIHSFLLGSTWVSQVTEL